MEKLKQLIEKITDKISEKTRLNKKLLFSVLLLFAGIIALLISEMPRGTKAASSVTAAETTENSEEKYIAELEERLTALISRIDGVGSATVMITLESSVEDVYLHDFDYGENLNSDGKSNIERKDEYVIVDDGQGEKGIVVMVNQPKIRGVAVVCVGGGSDVIKARVVETVTALLDVSAARVSVSEMG